ncbi:DUF4198 domain-containing protein [Siphonobacter sp. SORGH_AS_0500]|uniref:DUF4198 domain-containing protein n=1 Tax=Siphonobacter sp. SORGH_AS_0500 TaxID=1864824 RepID=UPI0028626084|nr:DUF4198 domain-containing protein [Siphonobacter sp. SORGH_AS_0500]MDR6195367.1 putative GH25 family protein [Siphonobacter sp. SORGH_AS_0500]
MKLKAALLSLFLTLSASSLFAHALWIETSPVGKKGQKQTVKIIYSEPGETPEKLADWYSDVKEFSLWLIGPDQKKTQLTVKPGEDNYTAEFTPEQDGVYTLAVGHTAKELGGATKYQFNSTAVVTVGKATAASATPNELNVSLESGKTYKVGQPIHLKGWFKDQASDKLHVSVFSPSGWNREVTTNASGEAEFTPLWPGTYRVEASKSEKEEGQHHGKDYKSVWRCATLTFEVTK